MRYKAAVIGCGRIGFQFDSDPKRKYVSTHIGAYRSVRQTELVAVCDSDEKKLNDCLQKLALPRGYADFKEMLENEKIDILSICTPPESHYAIVREAVKDRNIKAIFCEKPLAEKVADAEKIVTLCKRHGIILQVDHQRRFDPLHQGLRKLIANKKLGGIAQANFYYTAGIYNTGSHMLDLLRFLFGDVLWVEAFYSLSPSHKKEDPNLDGILKFKSGLRGTFQACDVERYYIFELNCLFEKGRIVLKDSGFDADFYHVRQNRLFSGYKELRKGKGLLSTIYRRNFMINAVKHLVDCIKERKESGSTGKDGLEALKIIEAAVRSANSHGKRIFIT